MVQRINKENFSDFVQLYNEVYGKNKSEAYLQQKYATEYTKHTYLGYLAYDKKSKKAIAYYGVIPYCFYYKGKKYLGAQAVDAATLKTHRIKGLFTALIQEVAQLLKENDFYFIYGFPNDKSYVGLKKSGWSFLPKMQRFSMKLKALPLQKIAHRLSFTQNLNQGYIESCLKKYLCNPQNNSLLQEGLATWRDGNFYDYRNFSPKYFIKLGTTVLWIKVSTMLAIGDIHISNEEEFPQVVESLKSLAFKLGVNEIVFHCSPTVKAAKLFAAHFDTFDSWHIGYEIINPHDDVPIDALQFNLGDLDTF